MEVQEVQLEVQLEVQGILGERLRAGVTVVSGPGNPICRCPRQKRLELAGCGEGRANRTYPEPEPDSNPRPNPSQEVHGLCSLCWGVQDQLCRLRPEVYRLMIGLRSGLARGLCRLMIRDPNRHPHPTPTPNPYLPLTPNHTLTR